MEDKAKTEFKERIKEHNKAIEQWDNCQFLNIQSISFDEVCSDLVVPISEKHNSNIALPIRLFNCKESINIGLIRIPSQFNEDITQQQFITDNKNACNLFDALLFMDEDSNFSNLGFKEISNYDNTNTHYRNPLIDFDSFKAVFKQNSIVILRTASATGTNRSKEAVQAAFELPEFYKNQINELQNTILTVSTGKIKCTYDELNELGIYCLHQIKRGATLSQSTFEDLSFDDEIRVSVLICSLDEVSDND